MRLATSLVLVVSCGQASTHVEVQAKQPEVRLGREHTPNPVAAADAALWTGAIRAAQWVEAQKRAEAVRWKLESAQSQIITPQVPSDSTASAPSYPWDCIANAETGGDWSMVGSTYSTGLGVINDVVYQYGSPQEAKDIMSGQASKQEQIDVVSRFTAIHGFGGWGYLTKQKCGL